MSVQFYYFDARGLAEPTRWILWYAGIDFEDHRVPLDRIPGVLPADIKAKSRWGQVPLAEFEGKSLTQSLAVARYFARKAKLIPEDPYLAALSDEYVDAVKDSMSGLYPLLAVQDAKERAEKLKEQIKSMKPKYLDVFEKVIKDNGGKYLVGNGLSMADIYLAYVLDHFKLMLGIDLAEGYPNMTNLRETVLNTPKIKAWIAKRPETKF